MSDSSLKNKTIKGLFWSAVEKFLVKGTSFIISLILARILSPDDYGLIGMLAIFIALSQIFIESGFVKALIQKKDRTEIDYSTVFYFNLGISLVLYLILFFAAPLIASFYNQPLLVNLLRILALNLVFGSLNVVQRAKLMIKMDFKTLAKVNLIGVIVGGVVGIYMAYSNFGVWALIGQTLTSTVALWCMFTYATRWKPLFIFSYNSFKSLFGFGSKLLISGLYATIINNISTVAIGKYYKPDQLGYYTRAAQYTDLIAYTLNDIVGTVTYPVLSSLQDQREKMVSVYAHSLAMTAFIVFPIMTLMAILAKPFMLITLTEKWLPCVVLLQILCFARVVTPLSSINMNILNAIGRPDLFLKVDLAKFPIIVLSMIITIPISVKAIVIGNLVTSIICYFINAYYPGKLFGYGAISQLKDTVKIIFGIIVMGGFVTLFMHFVSSIYLQLLIGGGLGIIIYVITLFILKSRELLEVITMIKEKINNHF